jgi:hypothetical protein
MMFQCIKLRKMRLEFLVILIFLLFYFSSGSLEDYKAACFISKSQISACGIELKRSEIVLFYEFLASAFVAEELRALVFMGYLSLVVHICSLFWVEIIE